MVANAGALDLTGRPPVLRRLNAEWHERALLGFAAIVVFHWAEHLVQAFQIWVLHTKKPAARGVLGSVWPWLISSEWLHYGFAVVMLVGLAVLAKGFSGRGRTFWLVALAIQGWHLVEHQMLFIQAQTGTPWFGSKVPTSVLQQAFPMARPEIHLFYNMLVTVPMLVALWFHMYPPAHERGDGAGAACTCDKTVASRPARVPVPAA